MRLTPQAVARTAQRPGLILATAEEWGIFCGALPVLGRLALVRLREGSGVWLDGRVARDLLQRGRCSSEWLSLGAVALGEGTLVLICQQRAVVYEGVRQANPTRWSGAIRCWSQPAEVWINKLTEEPDPPLELPLIKAA